MANSKIIHLEIGTWYKHTDNFDEVHYVPDSSTLTAFNSGYYGNNEIKDLSEGFDTNLTLHYKRDSQLEVIKDLPSIYSYILLDLEGLDIVLHIELNNIISILKTKLIDDGRIEIIYARGVINSKLNRYTSTGKVKNEERLRIDTVKDLLNNYCIDNKFIITK